MRTLRAISLCLLVVILAAACVQSTPGKQTIATTGKTVTITILDVKEAYALVQKNRDNADFVILDVRTPEEFESGYIEGAVNINYHSEDFVESLGKLDRNKLYLVYCRTGRRSSDTVSVMVRLGFERILRIAGDIVRWKSEGLPVVKAK